MGRELAVVGPHKPKERDVAAEREKRSRDQFLARHPLATMYRAIVYIDYAREEKNWRQFAFYANDLCSAYANLDSTLQAWLQEEHLPNPPDELGEFSSWMWLVYLASLKAARGRWQRFREGVSERIVADWGADFLPTVLRPVSSWNYEEPPF